MSENGNTAQPTTDLPTSESDAAPRAHQAVFVAAALLVGAFTGLGIFTFDYAEGTSYLSSDSRACANCHVMQNHYDAWVKSSHSKFAQCNDCHAPHNFVGKWYCKSRNGYFHSKAFTLQNFHEPIMIHDYNRNVVEQNCRRCHQELVHPIDVFPRHNSTGQNSTDQDLTILDPALLDSIGLGSTGHEERLSCIRCHADVGHPN